MEQRTEPHIDSEYLTALAAHIHHLNSRWWHNPATGEKLSCNFGEMVSLVHSELSEALEGDRKNLQDSHLPHRPSPEVEFADAIIRILDICGARGYDIGGAIAEKVAYNAKRADHTNAARLAKGGKKY